MLDALLVTSEKDARILQLGDKQTLGPAAKKMQELAILRSDFQQRLRANPRLQKLHEVNT
jgi:ribose 5-phosphate isomerase RpiB